MVDGSRPAEWLGASLSAGEVERSFVVALCAALVRGRKPAAVSEAAAMALQCELHELAPVFAAAVGGLELGLLLHADPRSAESSIEDSLLISWAAVERESERAESLLDRLRHAGLRDVELRLLMRLGAPDSIRRRLPHILAEDLPVEDAGALAEGLGRGADVATAVCDAASGLNASQRYAIWHAAVVIRPELADHTEVQTAWLAVEPGEADDSVH